MDNANALFRRRESSVPPDFRDPPGIPRLLAGDADFSSKIGERTALPAIRRNYCSGPSDTARRVAEPIPLTDHHVLMDR